MRDTPRGAALIDVGGTLWPDAGPAPEGARALQLGRFVEAAPELDRTRAETVVDCLRRRAANHEQALVQDTSGAIDGCLQANRARGFVDPSSARRAMCLPLCREDLFPDAPRLLQTVKDLGLRCILVSNAMWRDGEAYRVDLQSLELLDLVDGVISSVDVGYRKPHGKMFQAALAEADCPPSACVMIGDSETKDIQPAVRLRMLALRVAIESEPPATTSAHAIAQSLAEACAVLRSWFQTGER